MQTRRLRYKRKCRKTDGPIEETMSVYLSCQCRSWCACMHSVRSPNHNTRAYDSPKRGGTSRPSHEIGRIRLRKRLAQKQRRPAAIVHIQITIRIYQSQGEYSRVPSGSCCCMMPIQWCRVAVAKKVRASSIVFQSLLEAFQPGLAWSPLLFVGA
jgi:hypothetical protein